MVIVATTPTPDAETTSPSGGLWYSFIPPDGMPTWLTSIWAVLDAEPPPPP